LEGDEDLEDWGELANFFKATFPIIIGIGELIKGSK
jgi:hypothetical protein